MTGLTAVVTDDLALLSLLVITGGPRWQVSEIGGVLEWSVLPPWASLPVRQSAAIIMCFFLQLQDEHHYIMDLGGGHGLLPGLDKLTNVWLQAIHEGMHLVCLHSSGNDTTILSNAII